MVRHNGKEERKKEVISDWDMSLLKLSEALDDKNKIISAEKTRKRIFNGETKTFEWIDTKNILVTFEGNELPEKLSLYEDLTAIRVRPYIPAVKQCFKCYKYGHIKQYCKKEYNLCVVCDRESHGNCKNENKCINCGGKHKANFKGCPIYEYNRNLQEISAKNCISIYEAKRIVMGKNKVYQDPWTSPESWTGLLEAKKKL